MGFEEIPHTADRALRCWGQDLGELFVQAAQGMVWLLIGPVTPLPTVEAQIELSAIDAETLLVSWLSELLYLYERDGTLFTAFELEEISPTHLRARVRGAPIDQLQQQIKAVTFNELTIHPRERGLETTIVFDV